MSRRPDAGQHQHVLKYGQAADPLTVRRALRAAELRRGLPEVVAGAAALDQEVRWVHAGEAPGLPELLRGGELLLSTGMGIPRDDESQVDFISRLADAGVAGLVLELSGRYGSTPRALSLAAEQRGLPLIALHREVPFVEITEALHRHIVEQQQAAIERGLRLHERFRQLLLDGAGVDEVVESLALAASDTVLLERADGQLAYTSAGPGRPDRRIAPEPDERRSLIVPVPGERGEPWGRLHLVGTGRRPDDFDRVAAEQAAGVIALALARERDDELLAARRAGNLLLALTEGHVDEADARQHAKDLGLPERPSRLLPVAIGLQGNAPNTSDRAWSAIAHRLTEALVGHGLVCATGSTTAGLPLTLLVVMRPGAERVATADRVAAEARRCILESFRLARMSVCVADVARSWKQAGAQLGEAIAAVPAAHATAADDAGWFDATKPKLSRLLFELSNVDALVTFAHRRLAALDEHDARRSVKLSPTLEVFLACGGHKAQAARSLGLERQTLYNRLSRIEQLLGESLADEEVRLGLHVALWARRVLGGTTATPAEPVAPPQTAAYARRR